MSSGSFWSRNAVGDDSFTNSRCVNTYANSYDLPANICSLIRGNVIGAPPQRVVFTYFVERSTGCGICDAFRIPARACVHVRIVQPQAPTRIKTSPSAGLGRGQSVCSTMVSRPPCPMVTMAVIVSGSVMRPSSASGFADRMRVHPRHERFVVRHG